MKQEFYEKLSKIVRKEQILEEEPMKKHTTFRIGGPAEYLILPQTTEEIADVIKLCRQEEIPWYIVGNGSNLLVSDEGYCGVIIQLYRNYGGITVEGTNIRAGAGALLSQIASAAKNASLTGFEFAGGIPGTLGGAVVMNAGAYGGEMKEAVISLKAGDVEEIKAIMKDLTEKRVSKQPLEYPSAGSTFKRPEGYFAGKLIMDAGLRGYQVGGAQVSEKHCGFVINKGNATAADVCGLMKDVQEKVQEQFGVTLEPEVKFLGEF